MIGKFNCKNCGECCGPAPFTGEELRNIKRFLKMKDMKLPEVENELTCRFRKDDSCLIYPVRPIVCKLFGEYENLYCDKNNVKPKKAIAPRKKPIGLLNDLTEEEIK